MHRSNKNANYNISQMVADVLVLFISYFLSGICAFLISQEYLYFPTIWVLVVFGITMYLCMFALRMYDVTTFNYTDRMVQSIAVSVLVATICVGSVMFFTRPEYPSRLFITLFAAFCFVFHVVSHILHSIIFVSSKKTNATNVLFIGNSELYERYLYFIKKTSMSINICGRISFSDPEITNEQMFEQVLKDKLINEVVIVQDVNQQRHAKVMPLLMVCEEMGVTVSLMLNLYQLPTSNHYISALGTYPIVTYHNISLDKIKLFIKRLMDIVGSSVGLILASPILIITAIAIQLESPGNVIFKQVRIGKNSRPFKIYKFRSMFIDAEERKKELMEKNQMGSDLMFKMEDDPRITKVGKFIRKTSIDELPQLYNILKGDMSLVGTRPPTRDEVKKYERHHLRRISITPGLTGMWQVSGRSSITDFEQVVELDRQYIENWSIWLDIKLLFKTVWVVLKGRGAS